MTSGPRVLVVLPTFEEVDNLAGVVSRVRRAAPGADVLVVDDASPDGTGDLADRLAAADPRVFILHRPRKEGLGPAYLAGFRWGLSRCYDLLVEMDADGSHLPEQLPGLLSAARGADLVLGSRWVPGGEVRNWSVHRRLLSRLGNLYARLLLGLDLRDATGGYRVFRRATLERLGLDQVASAGYCFQVDLAWRARQAGLRVTEVPITFVERTAGRSKMDAGVVLESLWRITGWGLFARTRQIRAVVSTATAPKSRGGRRR